MLTGVTLTGADDHTEPEGLFELSDQYSFVEWGILIGSKKGVDRYPSDDWFSDLYKVCRGAGEKVLKLSLHLCGEPLRSLMRHGMLSVSNPIRQALPLFQRVQLNLGGRLPTGLEAHTLARGLSLDLAGKIPIVQVRHPGNALTGFLYYQGLHPVEIFDQSGGKGIEPNDWPTPRSPWDMGFAGGLSPENIAKHMPSMDIASGLGSFWIDMETKVRSMDAEYTTASMFDLDPCEQVLVQCKEYIHQP